MLSSQFHDQQLTCIAVNDSELRLEILGTTGTRTLTLEGLKKLRVSDFKEGNIINEARLFTASTGQCDEPLFRRLLSFAYDIEENEPISKKKLAGFLSSEFQRFQKGTLVILEIKPSYGSYVVAIGSHLHET
ncbi:hypothetical protein N5D48_19530 [Pseudomonas sp. GD03858]|uniref:hypothetical protein n=1 Tax=unclassified Pseudomonas TaxID=196821 RepID=UPI00244AC140|nr:MULTISPECIES: hypothetical protein [unclassified Pseudomonas]MDH0648592.1 hypothetical protein [Pseudomonas sp. GD03867]MDH0664598.1 hypothetical protein [Pseudomonas sp. GD03858]